MGKLVDKLVNKPLDKPDDKPVDKQFATGQAMPLHITSKARKCTPMDSMHVSTSSL